MPTTVEGDLAASTSADRAPRTLFVTNDFPPRIGGAQSYYWGVIRTLDPSEVAILAPAHIDAAAFDATHPYTVVRASTIGPLADQRDAAHGGADGRARRSGAHPARPPAAGRPAGPAAAPAARPALCRLPRRRRGHVARRRARREQPAAARARQRVHAAHRERVHGRGRAQADRRQGARGGAAAAAAGGRVRAGRPTTRPRVCASAWASTARSSSASAASSRARARTSSSTRWPCCAASSPACTSCSSARAGWRPVSTTAPRSAVWASACTSPARSPTRR